MDIEHPLAPRHTGHPHRARLRLTIGKRSALRADVAITSSGLLAIGGLVSSILLSTALVVRAARTGRVPGAR